MIKIAPLSIAGALLAFGFAAAPAHALALATFVSGLGSDSGVCTRALPCKTFAFALSQTAAGGLIVVLDPSGYGKVTITKAISILNDGVGTAGIAVSSGNAITINAGANDSVHLRGLTIEGFSNGGTTGIQFNSGGNLAIENCVFRGFTFAGINISPSTSSSFSVSNTIASNNSNMGIFVQPAGSAAVKGVLGKVTANNNFNGIFVDGTATTGAPPKVTIADSEASNNVNTGVMAVSSSGHGFPSVMLRNVVASNNDVGIEAEFTDILVAHSVVTGNNTGVNAANSGALFSYGDNDIDENFNNNTGILIQASMH